MVKSVIIFQKITDLKAFEEYLYNKVMPPFLKARNLSRIQVSKVKSFNDLIPENLLSIQMTLELYWESIDAMQYFVESKEGAEASMLTMNNPYAEAGAFMCKERFFVPDQQTNIEL